MLIQDHNAPTLFAKPFEQLTAEELYEILKARFNVFYMEQGIRYPDLDDVDYNAVHIFIRQGKLVTGYARLFPAEQNIWHAGRVLTTQRGEGLGRRIMEAAEDYAHNQGARLLHVNAQLQAEDFYLHLGYTRTTDIFMEADLPHVGMQKEV